jgi:membrane protein implicated in regulation of membrane protease activity
MDYISIFFITGIVLLIIDVMLINVNVLIFIGLSAILSSVIHSMGFQLPVELLFSLIGVTCVLSVLITTLLWKPLKNFQNKTSDSDTSSDLIGRKLIVSQDIKVNETGKVKFSGVEWTSKYDPAFIEESKMIIVGEEIEVTKVVGTTLWVKK